MKHAVCGAEQGLGVCAADDMPPLVAPEGRSVEEEPCEMCRAMVAGVFGMVMQSGSKIEPGDDAFEEHVAMLADVCEEMQFREPIRNVTKAVENCTV
eukprot:2640096-Prymnesium_polylepis.2